MEVKTAVRALTALAQESRLRAFRLLVQSGQQGLAAGEIAERLEIPAAIESERDGRSIRYALRIDGIRGLLSYLLQDCCQGRPDLCGPARCMPARKRPARLR
jgi:hypothetical protein